MNLRFYWQLFKDAFHEWSDDKASRLGAALAYYSVFSLAPLLIITIGIAGLVFERSTAQHQILNQVRMTVGAPVADSMEKMLAHQGTEGRSIWATVIGLVVLVFGASGVFIQLQDALNTIWKVEPKPGRGLWGIIQDRFLSLSVVFGLGFLLLVSLVVSAALQALGEFLTPASLPGGKVPWEALNNLFAFVVLGVVLALMFKILPDVKVSWRHVWLGAFVTSLLFTVGKYLIGLYLAQSGTASTFGAAGSVVVILVWVYYSSQILLYGAEFIRVHARKTEGPVEPSENARSLSPEELARKGLLRRSDARDKGQRAGAGG